jgi:hypothetical protein
VIDIAVGLDGTLYAVENVTAALPGRPLSSPFIPNTGRVVRQSGPDQSTAVLINTNPKALGVAPDGDLFVSLQVSGGTPWGRLVHMDSAELP